MRLLGWALLLGAATAQQPAPPAQPAHVLATLGDVQVVAFGAPGFAELPRQQRLLAYWLVQAANQGDALAWDQGYRHNLELVRLLRGILTHPQTVPANVLPRIRLFSRALYLHHGLHDPDTERKERPPFTSSELRAAALAAQAAGANLGLQKGASLEPLLRALEAPLFDPKQDPVRANKAPPDGKDPLLSSAVNEYSGVSLRELQGYKDRYPLNSRLSKENGKLIEQVYRAGAGKVPPGREAERIARVVAALEQAIPLARGSQRAGLELLAAHLRDGDPEKFRLSQREWLKDPAAVDYILGFIESYADPRAQKGLFEGFVGFDDAPRTEALGKLAANAQYYEDQKPWPAELKRTQIRTPAASALVIVGGSGENRPQDFSGVNLPNEEREREQFGAKSFLLPAADDALAELRGELIAREFAPPGLADELVRCGPQQRFALVAFHEIVGHASGKLLPGSKDPAEALAQNYNTLEEARADLVGHWHAQDPRTRELGLIPDARCQELYPQYATTDWFTSVAAIPTGDRVEEDHLRGAQLMIWWFTGKNAIAERHTGGKRYLVVADAAKWRAAAGELLTMLQTIKATGDAARLADLIEQHATRLEPQWRDEVIARIKTLGLPRRVVGLAPRLLPVLEGGKIVDATAAPVDDLDAQILRDWATF